MKRPPVIDLNDAIQHPGKHLDFALSTRLEDAEDIDLIEPIVGHLDVVSTGNLLLLHGEFRAIAVTECSRCLREMNLEIVFSVDEEFPIVGIPSGSGGHTFARVESPDEPTPLFHGNNLEYEELLRQDLILAMPAQPLCRPDCPGIPRDWEEDEFPRPEFEKLRHFRDRGDVSA